MHIQYIYYITLPVVTFCIVTSEPCSNKNVIKGTYMYVIAIMSAVWPVCVLVVFISTPLASSRDNLA